MSKIVNTVVEIGTFGLVKDITGVEGAQEAAQEAAGLQAEAAEAGITEVRRQFDVTQEGLQPFQEAGVSAIGQQQALLGLTGPEEQAAAFSALEQSPGQQFLRDRAQKNLLRNAAAIGGLGGGNVRSALVQQGVGFAQQDLQNQFGRLGQLAGQGQQTAAQIGQFGQQTSQNVQRGIQSAAEARASGILGGQQAEAQFTQGLFQLGGTALLASDKRLKTNIKKTGSVNGFNWYSWDWNELGEALGLFGESQGVIANEVQETNPELVGNKNGYLAVNYLALRVA